MGRNQEAVTDLEYAVMRLPNPVETRRVLNKVYAALGVSPEKPSPNELAEARRLVKEYKFWRGFECIGQGNQANPNPAYDLAIADVCISCLNVMSPTALTGWGSLKKA